MFLPDMQLFMWRFRSSSTTNPQLSSSNEIVKWTFNLLLGIIIICKYELVLGPDNFDSQWT